MSKYFKLIIIFLIIAAISIPFILAASTSDTACCISPYMISSVYCSPNVPISYCCPDYITQNNSYWGVTHPFGPMDESDCEANFFYDTCEDPGADCDLVCCCGVDLVHYARSDGQQVRRSFCNEIGGTVKIPNAMGLCDSTVCNITTVDPPEGDCNTPGHAPQLTNFEAIPIQGEKAFNLQWSDTCIASTYFVFRCDGGDCDSVGTTTTVSFMDDDPNLVFEKDYEYFIRREYPILGTIDSIKYLANLGDLECWGRDDKTEKFCLHVGAFKPYLDHMFANRVHYGIDSTITTESAFFNFMDITYGSSGYNRLNKAYHCVNNQRSSVDKTCSEPNVCVIKDNGEPECRLGGNCEPEDYAISPFGIYSFGEQECLDLGFCYYDTSKTLVDKCYNCNFFMSCYDYKSEDACNIDNCRLSSCQWVSTLSEMGGGVCLDNSTENCKWCNEAGTAGMDLSAYNSVFSICTEEKANALSTEKFDCYYIDGEAKICGEIKCADFEPNDATNCPTITPDLNKDNSLKYPPTGKCSIGVCQTINGECRKNADKDNEPDCGYDDIICQKDRYPPETDLIPERDGANIIIGFDVRIEDKLGTGERKTNPDGTTTYFCITSSSQDNCQNLYGYEYSINTTDASLALNGIWLADSHEIIATLDEGENIIYYYSSDKARNLGVVKTINVEAYSNTARPMLLNVEVEDGIERGDDIHTNNNNPKINISFVMPGAKILYAELKNIDTGVVILFANTNPIYSFSPLPDFEIVEYELIPPNDIQLEEGTYTLSIDAISQNSRRLGEEQITIKTKYTGPTGTVTPPPIGFVGDYLVNTTPFEITIEFPEEVTLISVDVNGDEIIQNFSSIEGTTFSNTLNLTEGWKTVTVQALDEFNNPAIATSSFVVNAIEKPDLWIVSPTYGVSSVNTFDLTFNSDSDIDCRYTLDFQYDRNDRFNLMNSFDSTGSTVHSTLNFDRITDQNDHILYVWCIDPFWNQVLAKGPYKYSFDLRVDMTEPLIEEVFTFPESPIAESPAIISLIARANEPVVCRFDEVETDYSNMRNDFYDTPDRIYDTIKTVGIDVSTDGQYTLNVACMNEADRKSDDYFFQFMVDSSIPLNVIDHTEPYQSRSTPTIAVETNKASGCRYSFISWNVIDGFLESNFSYIHTATLTGINLSSFSYIAYVTCETNSGEKIQMEVPFIIDITPPTMAYVNDTNINLPFYPESACYTDSLLVNWLAFEVEPYTLPEDNPGIISYSYNILAENGTILGSAECTAGDEWLWVPKVSQSQMGCGDFNLELADGERYLIEVIAENKVGLWSTPLVSDGVTIDTSLCDCTLDDDGCCKAIEGDGVCDPNCLEEVDSDCADLGCTPIGGDCCDPTIDDICDSDCPYNLDPDCMPVCTPDSCDSVNDQWCDNGFWTDVGYCDNCYNGDSDCGVICEIAGKCDINNGKWCSNGLWVDEFYCSQCRLFDSDCPQCENNACDTSNQRWCNDGYWSLSDYCEQCEEVDSTCGEDCTDNVCDITNRKWCDNGEWKDSDYCSNCGDWDSTCTFECENNACDVTHQVWCDSGVWNSTNYCDSCGDADSWCQQSCSNGECDSARDVWCNDGTWANVGYCDNCQDSNCVDSCTNNACDIDSNSWCDSGSWTQEGYCDQCGDLDYDCTFTCDDDACDVDENKWCLDGQWYGINYCVNCGLVDSECISTCVDGYCDVSNDRWCEQGVWTNDSYCSECSDFDSQCLGANCTSSKDDCCNYFNDTVCDPDCLQGADPNCGNCTSSSGDCCNPSNDGTCDTDCIEGTDPNCAATDCKNSGSCGVGAPCILNAHCLSGYCDKNIGKCAQSTCNDDMKNGDETDKDCGGDVCDECEIGDKCSIDLDCVSGNCKSSECQESDKCSDNKFSPGEADTDCGGICPSGCARGEHCDIDSDCLFGLECSSAECITSSDPNDNPNGDSDGDGIPDWWEKDNGLDANDPEDAEQDFDGDKLDNYQEYLQGTDPNMKDTDGDKFSDLDEIKAGTDPNDPKSKPAGLLKIILLILLILVVLAAIGYLVYTQYYQKGANKGTIKPNPLTGGPQIPGRQMQGPMGNRSQPYAIKRLKGQKLKKRISAFDSFASSTRGNGVTKITAEKIGEEQRGDVNQLMRKSSTLQKQSEKKDEYIDLSELGSKKPKLKRPKEEVFKQLSAIIKKDKGISKVSEIGKINEKQEDSTLKKLSALSERASVEIKKDLKQHSEKIDSKLEKIEKKVAVISKPKLVYSTKTGKKYHLKSCIVLKDTPVSKLVKFTNIVNAKKKKLKACNVCHPKQ